MRATSVLLPVAGLATTVIADAICLQGCCGRIMQLSSPFIKLQSQGGHGKMPPAPIHLDMGSDYIQCCPCDDAQAAGSQRLSLNSTDPVLERIVSSQPGLESFARAQVTAFASDPPPRLCIDPTTGHLTTNCPNLVAPEAQHPLGAPHICVDPSTGLVTTNCPAPGAPNTQEPQGGTNHTCVDPSTGLLTTNCPNSGVPEAQQPFNGTDPTCVDPATGLLTTNCGNTHGPRGGTTPTCVDPVTGLVSANCPTTHGPQSGTPPTCIDQATGLLTTNCPITHGPQSGTPPTCVDPATGMVSTDCGSIHGPRGGTTHTCVDPTTGFLTTNCPQTASTMRMQTLHDGTLAINVPSPVCVDPKTGLLTTNCVSSGAPGTQEPQGSPAAGTPHVCIDPVTHQLTTNCPTAAVPGQPIAGTPPVCIDPVTQQLTTNCPQADATIKEQKIPAHGHNHEHDHPSAALGGTPAVCIDPITHHQIICPTVAALKVQPDRARKVSQPSALCMGPDGHIIVCDHGDAAPQTPQPTFQSVGAPSSTSIPRVCIGDNNQVVVCPRDEL